MIAVDTNILVYSHRRDSAFFEASQAVIRSLAESAAPWAIPWPAVHEFLAIVTHPRIYSPASPLATAIEQIKRWAGSPSLSFIGEHGGAYLDVLAHQLQSGRVVGVRVHDARIAAICISHRVDELWTADRDFTRFPGVRVRNPLVR